LAPVYCCQIRLVDATDVRFAQARELRAEVRAKSQYRASRAEKLPGRKDQTTLACSVFTMEFRQILVPTDFGESARFTLCCARKLAKAHGATLHVLHVIDDPVDACGEEPFPELCRKREHAARDRLEGMVGSLPDSRIRLECRTGMLLIEIIRYARVHDIDLIVMGNASPDPQMNAPSSSALVRALELMTSAQELVRQAPCPVLVVQAPAHELVV